MKHPLRFEICTDRICGKFIYKHLETIEYLKKLAYFLRNLRTSRAVTREFLGLRVPTFQGIAFT